jgi:hypothetical protein
MIASLASKSRCGGIKVTIVARVASRPVENAPRFLTSKATGKSPRGRSRHKQPPGITTKDRLRSARPSSLSAVKQPERIASPQELAERAVHRLQVARSTLQEAWNNSGNATATAAAATKPPSNKGLVMDANWWFWNVLLAVSPALLIGVYCQFVVIPQMIKQNQTHSIQQEAAKLTWAESVHQLILYLQGEEIQAVKEKTVTETKGKSMQSPNDNGKNDAVQQQLHDLRQQLEQLEAEIQQNSMEEGSSDNASSNIRHRYVEEQRKQRRMQQQQSDGVALEDATASDDSGRLQKIVGTVQGWWSQYLEHMKDHSPPPTNNTSYTPSPATAAASSVSAKDDDDDDDAILPSPLVPSLPNSRKPCKITRSITHPRDQESEHPLWTLWHKPTD